MEQTPKFQRGHKLWNDKEETEPSLANAYFDCRDGVIKQVQYRDESGYGNLTQLLLCEDNKHDCVSIIRRVLIYDKWIEEVMHFDANSFEYLEKLLKGESDKYCKIELLRDY